MDDFGVGKRACRDLAELLFVCRADIEKVGGPIGRILEIKV